MNSSATSQRDGFRVLRASYASPAKSLEHDTEVKRKSVICDLFANQKRSIAEVAQELGERYGVVVNVLIQQGIIAERRQRASNHIEEDRRHSYFKSL